MTYDSGSKSSPQVMSHARALAENPHIEFLGAVDPNQLARAEFESSYGLNSFATVEDSINSGSPEIVVVASPTDTHLSVIESVLSFSSPRIILCEKPLAYQVAEAEGIIDLCVHHNAQLFVNYMRRADPATWQIALALQEKWIGPYLTGTCFYSKGLIHNASHFVNLLEAWFGTAEVMEASSSLDCHERDQDGLVDFELKFDGLRVSFRSLGVIDTSPAFLCLWGPSSRFDYDWGGADIRLYEGIDEGTGKMKTNPREVMSSLYKIQELVVGDLVEAYRGGEVKLCTDLEALDTLRVCQAVLRLVKSHEDAQ